MTPPPFQGRNGLHSEELFSTRPYKVRKKKMFKFTNPHTNPIKGAPMPIAFEGSSAMSIAWYSTEAEAQAAAAIVATKRSTYQGGFFHGMACGRSKGYDEKIDGVTISFAVTY